MADQEGDSRVAGRRGEIIDQRYTLGDVLGVGGMGVVYAAVQKRLDRVVAVKLPRPELVADPAVRARFRTEALAGSRLSHPNIARVIDFGEDRGSPYLVMEHVVGPRLGELVGTGRAMPIADAVPLVRAVLAALAEAHGQGIVHGDLKCDNILLEMRRDGATTPRIIDFGLARFTTGAAIAPPGPPARAAERFVSGTPDYLAPELVRGRPPTVATDIYAVGVILYELVTGGTPFGGGTSAQTMWRQIEDTVVPVSWRRPDAPIGLDAIVERALAKLPEDRYGSAAGFSAALADLVLVGGDARGTAVPDVFANEATTQPMTIPVLAVGSQPSHEPDRRPIAEPLATSDRDATVVAYLESARALIDRRDHDAAIAELETGVALLILRTDTGPVWRLQLTLAALYDRIGDRAGACRTAREAHEQALRVHSHTGRVRANELLARLLHADRPTPSRTAAPAENCARAERQRT